MADEQIKTNVVVGIGVEGGDSAANAIAKLRSELSKLKGEQGALDKLTRSFAGAKTAAEAGKSAAEGIGTIRDQAAALKPAIQAIRDAVKTTGLPQSYLKTIGLDSASITAGGKSLKNFEKLLGDVDKSYENTLDRRGAKIAAVADKERQIKSNLLEDLRDRQARAAIQERVQAAEAARAKIAAAKQTATQVAKASEEIPEGLRPTRFPRGQTPPEIRARLDAEHAANQAQYQAAKNAAATKQQLLSQLSGGLRGVRNQWATGFDQYGPSRAVLAGAKTRPISATDAKEAEGSLRSVASAGRDAASALRGIKGSGAQDTPILRALQKEIRANPALAGAVHGPKGFRGAEAAVNPNYAARTNVATSANASLARSYNTIASSAGGAAGGIRNFGDQQEAVLGTVRQFLGLAVGYQVLQGVAAELGQVFGHLKAGIIGFNAMIEQTTVGFTTLFKNQAEQLLAMGEGMTEQAALAADLTGKIDYIQMGFNDAEGAAAGMIETIREFANVTPFRFAELQESALRMRAFGFELQEVLNKNRETGEFEGGIVAVGNAVSALGGGADAFRRITYALGQMKQAGRVYQNDMMQLANAGIGGYRYIARALQKEITKDGSGSADKVKAGQEKLFAQLEANAIETVRRLTTNGQISGEAAARAILSGLEEDFGGGMEAQAKTFIGAFSTVADTSQSLVADAFTPLYNSIRDTTYELGQFLQKDEVRKSAQEFSKVIGQLTEGLSKLGDIVKDVVIASYEDLVGAISSATDRTKSLGFLGSNVFGGFVNGIMTVTELLKNEFARQMLYAAGLVKLLFAFTGANPLLASIMAIITAIGILRQAYDQNFLGFGKAIDDIATNFGPLIKVIRDELIPLFAEAGEIFTSALFTVIMAGFEALEPAITLIIGVLKHLLKFVKEFEGPVKALTVALLGAFALSKLGLAITAISRMIQALAFQFQMLGRNAVMAKVSMASAGAVPARYGGMPIAYGGPAGPATRLAAGGGGSAMTNVAMGVGMAGMIGGSVAEAAGAPEWITSTVQNVSTALFGFAALKSIIPAGTFTTMVDGLKNFLGAIKAYALVNYPVMVSGLKQLKDALVGIPVIGTALSTLGGFLARFATGLGGIVRFIMSIPGIMLILGQGAATGGATLFPMFDVNNPASLTRPGGPLDLGVETRARNAAEQKPTIDLLDALGRSGNMAERLSPETEELFRKQIIPQITGKDFFGNTKDLQKVMEEQMQKKTLLFGTDEEKAAFAQREEERIAKVRTAYYEYLSKVRMYVDNRIKWGDGSAKNLDLIKKTNDAMKLLVEQQKEANGNNDYLQWRLAKVKDAYQEAVDLLKQLATQTLQRLLNPATRVNPYTGLEEAGLTIEEQMQIQQEMSFTTWENASGMVRSFDEYKDILEAITPLSEADMENGQISLKAVNVRLQKEKERRKELELIRRAAEAEYDLGVEMLRQYDQSIDPLERAVNLRKAQLQYSQEIEDLQIQGLETMIDSAKISAAYTKATRETKRKLEEFKAGQQMILDQMTAMFQDYNEDIANILSNPSLSAAQRKDAVKERLEKLYTDLETQFGITRDMLQEQLDINNQVIDNTLAALNNPTLPDINWGGPMAAKLQAGGFSYLEAFLRQKAILLAQLSSAALNAASGDINLAAKKTRDDMVKLFKMRLSGYNLTGGPGAARGRIVIEGMIADFAKMTKWEDLITMSNRISAQLTRFGLKRGGIHSGKGVRLVGEAGPELFLPESRGLVLNNTVSSRLMGMLSGGGSTGGSGNVIINVNNPVIRDDQDIRKLADRITRAQVSAFRTAGGRLS